jgi:hypothetical protein
VEGIRWAQAILELSQSSPARANSTGERRVGRPSGLVEEAQLDIPRDACADGARPFLMTPWSRGLRRGVLEIGGDGFRG